MADISKITLPGGQTYDIKDAVARAAIEAIGDCVYWIGVTTDAITDGASTPTSVTITGSDSPVTPKKGGMVQYNGEEFIWSGEAWQSVGKNNFGALAFKSSAETTYEPTGTVTAGTATATTTTETVNSITDVGSMPTYTVSSDTLVITAGVAPTKGTDVTVVKSIDKIDLTNPTFKGNSTTITVS